MKKIFTAVLLLALLAGCSKKKFDGSEYVSYQPGNAYTFTGPMAIVVDSAKATPEGVEYIVYDVEQGGQPLSREVYLKKNGQSYWKEFDGAGMGVQRFNFEPPILASPFSDKIGDKFATDGVELRQDSTRLRFHLEAEVLAVEDVTVPAAFFPKCVKIRSKYTYLDTTSTPLMSGEMSRWYARGVGLVKYQAATDTAGKNVGELLSAKIGDRIYPPPKK